MFGPLSVNANSLSNRAVLQEVKAICALLVWVWLTMYADSQPIVASAVIINMVLSCGTGNGGWHCRVELCLISLLRKILSQRKQRLAFKVKK